MKNALYPSLQAALLLPVLFLVSCGGAGPESIVPPSISVETAINVSTPTWTWSSGAADTFRYQLNSEGDAWTETQEHSYTPARALADGTHTLYVQGKAKDGTWTASGTAAIEIDTSLSFTASYSRADGYYVSGAIGVAATSDGKTVLVAGQTDASLVVFDRDPATGLLSSSSYFRDGVNFVDGLNAVARVAASPDGTSVYATGYSDNAIAVFDRDSETGVLTYTTALFNGGGIVGLGKANDVAVTPDGKTVLVTGYSDNALVVFDRSTATGVLTYSQTFSDDSEEGGTIETFLGPQGIAVSPDGTNVYVNAYTDSALVVFDRDTDTGTLSYSTTITDTELLNPYGISISPDGKNVYVASYGSDRILVFDRYADTGALSLLESHVNDTNGVESLDGPFWIAIPPDAKSVYVTARETDSLVVFDRDLDTGTLVYRTFLQDETGEIEDLDKPLGVTVSPCGGWVYVTALEDFAVTVFDR